MKIQPCHVGDFNPLVTRSTCGSDYGSSSDHGSQWQWQSNKIVSKASSSISKIGASSCLADALAECWLTEIMALSVFYGKVILRTE